MTGSDIAALFGSAASSDTKVATPASGPSGGSADKISGAALIGAGTSAARSIQTIVTQLQVEKMQANVQGKASSVSLASASVSANFGTTVASPADGHPIAMSMSAFDSIASATADDTQGAFKALLGQVKSREAQIEGSQDGVLTTTEQWKLGRGAITNLLAWTASSASMSTSGVANEGVLARTQEDVLQNALNSVMVASPQPNGPGEPAVSSQPRDISGDALLITLNASQTGASGDYSQVIGKAQDLIAAYTAGTLAGLDWSKQSIGSGFAWFAQQGDTGFSVSGSLVSNYDFPTATQKNSQVVRTLDELKASPFEQLTQYSSIVAGLAKTLGGTAISVRLTANDYSLTDIAIVVPLTRG